MTLPILAKYDLFLLEDVVWLLTKPPERHRLSAQDH